METDGQDRGSDGRMRGRHQGVNANSLRAKTSTASHLSLILAWLPPFLPPFLFFFVTNPSASSLLSCLKFSDSPPSPSSFSLSPSLCPNVLSPYLPHFLPRPTASPILLKLSPEANTLAEIRERMTTSLSPTHPPTPPAVAQQGTSQCNICATHD